MSGRKKRSWNVTVKGTHATAISVAYLTDDSSVSQTPVDGATVRTSTQPSTDGATVETSTQPSGTAGIHTSDSHESKEGNDANTDPIQPKSRKTEDLSSFHHPSGDPGELPLMKHNPDRSDNAPGPSNDGLVYRDDLEWKRRYMNLEYKFKEKDNEFQQQREDCSKKNDKHKSEMYAKDLEISELKRALNRKVDDNAQRVTDLVDTLKATEQNLKRETERADGEIKKCEELRLKRDSEKKQTEHLIKFCDAKSEESVHLKQSIESLEKKCAEERANTEAECTKSRLLRLIKDSEHEKNIKLKAELQAVTDALESTKRVVDQDVSKPKPAHSTTSCQTHDQEIENLRQERKSNNQRIAELCDSLKATEIELKSETERANNERKKFKELQLIRDKERNEKDKRVSVLNAKTKMPSKQSLNASDSTSKKDKAYIDTLRARNGQLRLLIDSEKQKNAQISKELKTANDKIKQLQCQYRTVNSELERANAKHLVVVQATKTLKQDIHARNQIIADLGKSLKENEVKVKNASERLAEEMKTSKGLRHQTDKNKSEIDTLTDLVEMRDTELAAFKTRVVALEINGMKEKTNADDVRKKYQQLRALRDTEQNQIGKAFKQEFDKLKQLHHNAVTEMNTEKARADRLETDMVAKNKEADTLREELDNLKRDLSQNLAEQKSIVEKVMRL